jgi:hypothetical protein
MLLRQLNMLLDNISNDHAIDLARSETFRLHFVGFRFQNALLYLRPSTSDFICTKNLTPEKGYVLTLPFAILVAYSYIHGSVEQPPS